MTDRMRRPKTEIFSNVNGAPLHIAFHDHGLDVLLSVENVLRVGRKILRN